MHQDSYVGILKTHQVIQSLGVEGVEIWKQAFDKHGIEKVMDVYHDSGLEVFSVNPYFDFTSGDATYTESIEDAKKMLEYCSMLHCERIRVYSSKYGSIPSSLEATVEQWDRGIRGITELCDMALPLGVTCVLETNGLSGQLFDSTPSVMRLYKEVNKKNLTINFQPPLSGEHYLESAHNLAPFIGHLHVHNWIGGWPNIVPLDTPEGEVDIERYLAILIYHGFDGCISIEHVPANDFTRIGRDIAFLKKTIASIIEKRARH
jgi:sugar phosphate isomerase/epimerase